MTLPAQPGLVLLAGLLPPAFRLSEKTVGSCSSSCFRHCPIWLA